MKITYRQLKQLSACAEGLEYFFANKLEGIDTYELIDGLNSEDKYNWTIWLLSHLFDAANNVRLAIFSAELVLHIFERAHPGDIRPRQAIDAAKDYLLTTTTENKARAAAVRAADAAHAASWAARGAGAGAGAGAAAWAAAAAGAAAWAARGAAACAAANADAAAAAACAAANAVHSDTARDAYAKKEAHKKIVNYGVELLKNQEVTRCQ